MSKQLKDASPKVPFIYYLYSLTTIHVDIQDMNWTVKKKKV